MEQPKRKIVIKAPKSVTPKRFHIKKEPDYDTIIKSFMLEKYLALASMDYMDEECDALDKRENIQKVKKKQSKKCKSKSKTPKIEYGRQTFASLCQKQIKRLSTIKE